MRYDTIMNTLPNLITEIVGANFSYGQVMGAKQMVEAMHRHGSHYQGAEARAQDKVRQAATKTKQTLDTIIHDLESIDMSTISSAARNKIQDVLARIKE